jgi:hypothetical protein
MSNECRIVVLRREQAALRADRVIADAWEQIERAGDLLDQLEMQRVEHRIRSSSQEVSPAS